MYGLRTSRTTNGASTTDALERFSLLEKFQLAEESLTQPNLMQSIDNALLSKPQTGLRSTAPNAMPRPMAKSIPFSEARAGYLRENEFDNAKRTLYEKFEKFEDRRQYFPGKNFYQSN